MISKYNLILFRIAADDCLDPSMKEELKWRWILVDRESEATALGFFTISKSSMISGFSTILGYLIILIQFKLTDVVTDPVQAY